MVSRTSDANIIDIGAKLHEAAPVAMRQERYDECRHRHTSLDSRLRTVACVDCGEERLDPFEVLAMLASEWHSWQREAAQLKNLNSEYYANQKAQWERARDRHLHANPDHAAAFNAQRTGWIGEPACRRCRSLEYRYDRSGRWDPRPLDAGRDVVDGPEATA